MCIKVGSLGFCDLNYITIIIIIITFVFLSSEGIESTCKLCEEVLCNVMYYVGPFSTLSN